VRRDASPSLIAIAEWLIDHKSPDSCTLAMLHRTGVSHQPVEMGQPLHIREVSRASALLR
jgi:hypothetical protein